MVYMILVNLNKALLIYKAPPDTHPDLQAGIRIARSCQAIVGPPKTPIGGYFCGVQVFCPYKRLKTPDTELKKGRNIGTVANGH